MKKYEIQYLFKEDEQHLTETTQRYPRTLDEAFPKDAPHGEYFKSPFHDTVLAILLAVTLLVIVLDVFFWRA